ncbi:uncharacterized protein LOC125512652 [Triticum urartu]|nr:uncharacterized protein LOC125512584 [Triticum urartu]XP_048533706.1 uncharacterized protein LOC125512652 [Triticum urartu]
MGAWFSYPGKMILDWMAQRKIPRVSPRSDVPSFDVRKPRTPEEFDDHRICKLALYALRHYNSNHPDAMFWFPDQPKVACVAFREDYWYHLNFSARRTEGSDEQSFFAELRYVQCPYRLIVETCTILEKLLSRFRSSCALCVDGSNILHPSDIELGCGKEGHEEELYRERCKYSCDRRRKDYFRKEMLETPSRLGGDKCPNFGVERRDTKSNSTVKGVNIAGTGGGGRRPSFRRR